MNRPHFPKNILLCFTLTFAWFVLSLSLLSSAIGCDVWETVRSCYDEPCPVSIAYDGAENTPATYDVVVTLNWQIKDWTPQAYAKALRQTQLRRAS